MYSLIENILGPSFTSPGNTNKYPRQKMHDNCGVHVYDDNYNTNIDNIKYNTALLQAGGGIYGTFNSCTKR